MTEVKDPAIKLFGKTIPLLPKQRVSVSTSPTKENFDGIVDEEEDEKTLSESKLTATRQENYLLKPSKAEDQRETSMSQEKTLKKPDQILPCPRCNSMETKFCYYNNYNVNQPRHFCKKCQRYWTAGGTMRSVPVGSGRRKNKSSCASHYRHIMVSDCLQAARAKGTVLSFGADSPPLCEKSIALNLFENSRHLVKISISGGGGRENGDNDTRSSAEKGGNGNPVFHQPVAQNLPCFQGPGPWFFPIPCFPPPPYWGYSTLPGSWNVPWIPPPASSTLGKHLRDVSDKEETLNESDSERRVCIPKTLRVDDLNEATKSSIWSTLGIKNEKNDSTNAGGGLCKASHSKGEEKTYAEERYLALQTNPAALSRSFKFRESVNEC